MISHTLHTFLRHTQPGPDLLNLSVVASGRKQRHQHSHGDPTAGLPATRSADTTLRCSIVVPGKMLGAPARILQPGWQPQASLVMVACASTQPPTRRLSSSLPPRGLLTCGTGREHVALGGSPGYSVDRALGAVQPETQGAEGTFEKPAQLLGEPGPGQLTPPPYLALADPESIPPCPGLTPLPHTMSLSMLI